MDRQPAWSQIGPPSRNGGSEMDVIQFVLLALAGGLGAVSRFVLVEWIAVRWRGTLRGARS